MEDLYQSQMQLQTLIKQVKTNFKKQRKHLRTAEYIKTRLSTLDLHWEKFYNNDEKLREFNNLNHAYFYKNIYENTYSIYIETRELIQNSTPAARKLTKLAKPNPLIVQSMPRQNNTNQTSTRPQPLPVPEGSKNQHESSFTLQGNNSKLGEMLRKQSSNFKALARTLANIELDSVQEKWELEDILKSLDSRWAAIDTLHWEIDSELSGMDEYYENTFTKYENEYTAMKKQINSKIWSTSQREKFTPRLDIPVFHGNYQQWISFKDLFTEAIHSNPCLSNAQKMQYLKSKIKDEPEQLIQHLPISSDNYTMCWEILNHHYNNKNLIFTTHINNIINLPPMQQATSSYIKRLHNVTVESLNGIITLGVNIDTWDPILVHLLQQKLDSETHNEYITALKEPRELPSLKDFLAFLEGKFTAMESSQRKQEAAVNQPSLDTLSTSNNQYNILLATAMIKILGNDGVPHMMRALVDPGSQMCLISEKAAQQLGLPRQQFKGMITGVDADDNICKGRLHLNCLSVDENYSFNTEAFIMNTITGNMPTITFPKTNWEILNSLPLADSNYYVSNSVDILLGAEVYASILMGGIFKDDNSPLVVQETQLGWILRGAGAEATRQQWTPLRRPGTAAATLSIELFVL